MFTPDIEKLRKLYLREQDRRVNWQYATFTLALLCIYLLIVLSMQL